MTEERTQLPCLDEKQTEKNPQLQKWLERFKQNTKRKHNPDIGPIIKEEQ